jgi:hypothetical protein
VFAEIKAWSELKKKGVGVEGEDFWPVFVSYRNKLDQLLFRQKYNIEFKRDRHDQLLGREFSWRYVDQLQDLDGCIYVVNIYARHEYDSSQYMRDLIADSPIQISLWSKEADYTALAVLPTLEDVKQGKISMLQVKTELRKTLDVLRLLNRAVSIPTVG